MIQMCTGACKKAAASFFFLSSAREEFLRTVVMGGKTQSAFSISESNIRELHYFILQFFLNCTGATCLFCEVYHTGMQKKDK